jgi:hypothetical protein
LPGQCSRRLQARKAFQHAGYPVVRLSAG